MASLAAAPQPVRASLRPQRRPRSQCAPARPCRKQLRAVAELQKPAGLLGSVVSTCERMLARYDFVSTGCGALAVTTYCVMRGQDMATAAGITVTATITGLVLNELLFANDCNQRE